MGAPKEGLRLADGRSMIEHVIDAVRAALGDEAPVAIVGNCDGWDIPRGDGFHHVLDRRHGKGPMGGLEALLGSGLAENYLVCTCDQPLLTPELLQTLASNVIALGNRVAVMKSTRGDELDPFPCLLPESWLEQIQYALGEDRLSVRALLRGGDPVWVMIPNDWARQVRSINTPEDAAELR